MKLVALQVQHFGCIKHARLELSAGLNVLYGSNDIGKSTLVRAIRAGLLLPHNSSAFKDFLPWQEPDAAPQVQLTFEVVEGGLPRFYRVSKQFGQRSLLEWSNDGRTFQPDKAAREVDEKLRELLQWGVPAAGSGRGMPDSFLLKVLMASQPEVTGILGAALADDKEPSGKQRILGAMAAMAEDPLFKQVLSRAHERVNKAFSATGRRRVGKDSPWIEIRDKINKADEEVMQLRAQKDQSAAVLGKLRLLDEDVLVFEAEASRAQEQLRHVSERWTKQLKLEPLKLEVARAQSALQDQLARQASLEAAKAEETRLGLLVQDAAKAQSQSQLTVEAQHTVAVAAEKRVLQLQNEDAARDAQLIESRLRERQTKLQAEIEACTREGELAHTVGLRFTELQTLQARAAQLQAAADAGDLEIAAAQNKIQVHEQRVQQARLMQRVWRQQELQTQWAQAEAAAKALMLLKQQAVQLRTQAAALDSAPSARALPDETVLHALQQLHAKLEAQQAALNLGLTATVSPSAPALKLEVSADGGASEAQTLFVAASFSAQQTLELHLPGASIALRVGNADSVRALEQLRLDWQREGEPALRAAGVAGLRELEEAIQVARAQRQEAAQLRRHAGDKDQLAGGLGEHQVRAEQLQKQLEAGALALGATDLGELIKELQGVRDEAELGRALTDAEQQLRQVTAALSSRKETLLTQRAQLGALGAQVSASQSAHRAAAARLGADWQAQLGTLTARLETLQAQKQDVDRELATQTVQHHAQLQTAEAEYAAAQAALATATATQLAKQTALRALEKTLDEHRGRVAALTQAHDPAQSDAARAHVAQTTSAYQQAELGCLVEGKLLAETQLQAAQSAVNQSEASAREKRTERDQVRGGLMEVGGDVVEEELRDAAQALAVLKRDQDELEVDYEAWQLLETALKEAEQAEASNLGQLLGAPLQARFASLTGGRYTQLELGPDLRTAGFVAGGAVREVEALSAGTQQQLSTLFRLCLAESLQTAVILDDHLSQTDSKKMLWFRMALDEVARKSQVLVITCWPEHYKPAGNAVDTSRRIDAAAVIERY